MYEILKTAEVRKYDISSTKNKDSGLNSYEIWRGTLSNFSNQYKIWNAFTRISSNSNFLHQAHIVYRNRLTHFSWLKLSYIDISRKKMWPENKLESVEKITTERQYRHRLNFPDKQFVIIIFFSEQNSFQNNFDLIETVNKISHQLWKSRFGKRI